MTPARQLLLDTCAAIWITENAELSPAAIAAMDACYDSGEPVWISPITAWERGMLVAKGRLASPIPLLQWFNRLLSEAQLMLLPLGADVLIDASFLPGDLHGDPADRILIAAARAGDLTILTRDQKILTYAAKGHVRALAC